MSRNARFVVPSPTKARCVSVTMDRIEEVLTRRSREFTVPDSPVDPVTAAVIMAELFNVDRPMLEVLVDVAKARLARA